MWHARQPDRQRREGVEAILEFMYSPVMESGTESFDCVVPAAGKSARMERWKLLLPVGADTVVARSVRNALGFCSRVILVTGFRGEELRRLFDDWPAVTTVQNPEYSSGMFSSIRAGVRHVRSERFFVALADMPFIRPDVFRALAAVPASPAGSSAARPYYQGNKGHPVLLSHMIIDKILQFDNSHTMQDVLRSVSMYRLATDDKGVLMDIDTPQDYRDAGNAL